MGAVRIAVRGACEAHKDLHQSGRASEVTAEIRNLANEFGDELWIERLCFETAMPIDLEKLRHSSTLMGDLLQLFESIQEDEDELLQLAAELRPLDNRAHAELNEAGVDLHDPALLKEWMQKAEGMLYSQLWGNA